MVIAWLQNVGEFWKCGKNYAISSNSCFNVGFVFEWHEMCWTSIGCKILASYEVQFRKEKQKKISEFSIYFENFLFNFSLASKTITIINTAAGSILVLFPILFRIIGIPNSEWMLPLTMEIFFTNNKSHPGYELNYMFCAYSISISSWVFTGTIHILWRAFFTFFSFYLQVVI